MVPWAHFFLLAPWKSEDLLVGLYHIGQKAEALLLPLGIMAYALLPMLRVSVVQAAWTSLDSGKDY